MDRMTSMTTLFSTENTTPGYGPVDTVVEPAPSGAQRLFRQLLGPDPTNNPGGGSNRDGGDGPASGMAVAVAMGQRLIGRTLYSLVGFPLALAAFVIVVTGLSTGFGTLVIFVGVAIIAVTLLAAQGFATVERAQMVSLLGTTPAIVRYRQRKPTDQPIRQLTRPLTDVQRWLDVLHALVILPVAIFSFAITVAWWSAAIGGTTWVLWGWLLPNGPSNDGLPELLGLGDFYLVQAGFYTALGLLALITLPLGMWMAAGLRSVVSEALLFSMARQQRQIDTLVAGRDATHAAEEGSRRRLERDIHDGPQQRLVRLSMDLGRAQLKADDAPEEVRSAIDSAKQQVQETLDELRALSKGIAPPVLIDRGLVPAIQELGARFNIPVRCDIRIGDRRLPPHVETAAYFVTSEALTNVAKHSRATEVTIQLEIDGADLRIVVHDDGVGGAALTKGHGLAGLDQRVRGLGGTLTLLSPAGGPTSLMAELPFGVS